MATDGVRATDITIPSAHREQLIRLLRARGLPAHAWQVHATQYHPDFGAHAMVVYLDGPVSASYDFDVGGAWLGEVERHIADGLYDRAA